MILLSSHDSLRLISQCSKLEAKNNVRWNSKGVHIHVEIMVYHFNLISYNGSINF